MKKLLMLFCISFIAIIIAVSVISRVDNTYSKIQNHSFNKTTKSYEIKVNDNIITAKTIVGGKKEGLVLYSSWPWLPLAQFEKYRKYFINGATFYNTY